MDHHIKFITKIEIQYCIPDTRPENIITARDFDRVCD